MKKLLFLSIFIYMQLLVVGQNKLLADVVINDSLVIAGISERGQSTYEFIVTNPTIVKQLAESLEYGKELNERDTTAGIMLSVIRNKLILKQWLYLPKSSQVLIEGASDGMFIALNSYFLKNTLIKDLADKYPVHFEKHNLKILSYDEYKKVNEYLTSEKSVVIINLPTKSEADFQNPTGTFHLTFPNNSKFSSPSVISKYLEVQIKKPMPTSKFSAMYEVNEFNNNNIGKFYQMTIWGDKKMFDNFEEKNVTKSDWVANAVTATYYQKK